MKDEKHFRSTILLDPSHYCLIIYRIRVRPGPSQGPNFGGQKRVCPLVEEARKGVTLEGN